MVPVFCMARAYRPLVLGTLAATLAAGAFSLLTNSDRSSLIQQPASALASHEGSYLPPSDNDTSLVQRSVAEQQAIERLRYAVSGNVFVNNQPLNGLSVKASVSSRIQRQGEAFVTRTQTDGAFTIPVLEDTIYTVTAEYDHRIRTVEAIPHRPVNIFFAELPDLTVHVTNGAPIGAYLLTEHNQTLEGILAGHTVHFPDLESGLYRLLLHSADNWITDKIPFFDEDVDNTYTFPSQTLMHGKVLDTATRQGISSATLTFTLPESLFPPLLSHRFSQTLQTDKEGNLLGSQTLFSQQPYTATIRAPDYITTTREATPNPQGNIFLLEKGMLFSGHVVDSQNRPVSHALVYVLNPLSNAAIQHLEPSTTNNQGEFSFRGVDPLQLRGLGERPAAYVPVAVKKDYHQPTLEQITLEQGKTPLPLTLQLANNASSLDGIVVGQNNDHIPAYVHLRTHTHSQSGRLVIAAPFAFEAAAATRPDGTFSFGAETKLPPGTYELTLWPDKSFPEYRESVHHVTLDGSQRQTFYLTKGNRIEGTVSEHGLPVSQANIVFTVTEPRPRRYFTQSDARGAFATYLPPTSGNISYFAYHDHSELEGLLSENQHHLPLAFPQETATFHVVDAETQQPIPHYSLFFQEQREHPYSHQRTVVNKYGRTTLSLRYPLANIIASAEGYEASSVYRIPSVTPTDLTLELYKKK